jgi:hypothetical protein
MTEKKGEQFFLLLSHSAKGQKRLSLSLSLFNLYTMYYTRNITQRAAILRTHSFSLSVSATQVARGALPGRASIN